MARDKYNFGSNFSALAYGPSGRWQAIASGQTLLVGFMPLPSGTQGVYSSSGLKYYSHADWLGSERAAGTPSQTISSTTAYAPFGEIYGTSHSGHDSFTGQLEIESGTLLDFPARRYSPTQGRWISPDPAGLAEVDPTTPQTWNRYAYVVNNPLANTDPSGLGPQAGCGYTLSGNMWTPAPCSGLGGSGVGGDESGSCNLDDWATSCSMVESLAYSGSAFQCPYNYCGTSQNPAISTAEGVSIWIPNPFYNVDVSGSLLGTSLNWESPGDLALLLELVHSPSIALYPGAPSKDPCANATLTAAGVDARQQIAVAQLYIAAGKNVAPANSLASSVGGLIGYYLAVHTSGPNDIKDLPGHSRQNPIDVNSGNISFGITCPYGAGFCQLAAGVAQSVIGRSPDFSGTLATGFDTPSDNYGIRIGQAMRAAGCHE